MTIIRTQAQIADASTADLIETYNALTGKSIKKFSSRGAGESQVANAIMAAQDRAGHLGVPKGAAPVAITADEATAKEKAAGAAPAAPLKPLRAKLAATAGDASPNKAKPKAERKASGKLVAVVPTCAGESKLQAASERAAVFAEIVKRHGKDCRVVTIEELNAHFGRNTSGFVGKLLEKHHLIAVDAA